MQHMPGAKKMLGLSGICSPALAGRVRRGRRRQQFPGFASQTHSPETAWGAVTQPVEGCCSKKSSACTENAWSVRHMQPGFSRACAPRGAFAGAAGPAGGRRQQFPGFAKQTHSPKAAWGAVQQPVKGCCSKKATQARRIENAWSVRYMQPGFSRACAPREPAGMDAGVNNFLGLRSKPTAQNRHGGRFWKGESRRLSPAQGIEAEIPEAPRLNPHAKRVD
jgi:hypothetical protein